MKASMVAALDPTSAVPASSLAGRFAVSDDAQSLLAGGANLRRYLDALVGRGLAADAMKVIAATLPKRYVVAWACECLKIAFAQDPKTLDVDRAGLALAQQWLSDPTEEKRQAAIDFAQSGEFKSVGAWIAASAGWSGGSLAPRGFDAIPPPDRLPAEAAVAALSLAAGRAADYATTINGFVSRALQIFGSSGASS
jgi:hypothetical protein